MSVPVKMLILLTTTIIIRSLIRILIISILATSAAPVTAVLTSAALIPSASLSTAISIIAILCLVKARPTIYTSDKKNIVRISINRTLGSDSLTYKVNRFIARTRTSRKNSNSIIV